MKTLNVLADTIYPEGIIYFNHTFFTYPSTIKDLIPLFELDDFTTFEEYSSVRSRLDTNIVYKKYNQHYQGIPVNGGGVVQEYPSETMALQKTPVVKQS